MSRALCIRRNCVNDAGLPAAQQDPKFRRPVCIVIPVDDRPPAESESALEPEMEKEMDLASSSGAPSFDLELSLSEEDCDYEYNPYD